MTSRGRRVLIGAGLLAAAVAGTVAFKHRDGSARPQYRTATAERGDIETVVGATGTLEAVTTVQVGSQVSGTILSLHADFNDEVRKGQVLARLDPSALDARLQQARANLVAAEAGVARTRAEAADAERSLARNRELAGEGLVPASQLDTAGTAAASARAQVQSAQASVAQAAATVRQAEVDVERSVITSPIDGVVVARSVDVGQTVAASLQAPTLFVIAQDLSRMQVVASIDEADVGRVQEGQEVTFTVDAWPGQDFRGRVREVRLQPTVTQNVVTYSTIIDAENPELRLKPGMTATVNIVIEGREDVLRVPASALSFRPEGWDPQAAFAERRRERGGEDRPRAAEGQRRQRPQIVFVLKDGNPEPVRVTTGAGDGRFVEILDGVSAGTPVVVGLEVSGSQTARPASSPGGNNPFAPPRPQRRQR